MNKKQVGFGSTSLILLVLGVLWASDINHFCIGDYILNTLGMKSWSSGNHLGNHIGILYSLIFLLPSCYIAYKWPYDLGANICLKISTIFSLLIIGLGIMFYL
ncbi:MAG: hypothetical protein E7231_04300 [Cellulosilyticum sp.]|nr:hypothetical protein [Cellulosilyticum sp.]